MIIYKITNKISGKCYIGQTINRVSNRFYRHKNDSSFPIGKAIKKYGITNFDFEIICSTWNRENLNALERYFISHYNSISPNGYNLEYGGTDTKEKSKETIEKIRLSSLGRKILSKRIPIVSVDLLTKEILKFDCIRDAAKHFNVCGANISAVLKGKRFTTGNCFWLYPEQLENFDFDAVYERVKSEIKAKLSKSHLGQIAHNRRSIKDQDGTIYNSIAEAAKKLNLHPASIIKQLKNRATHVKGFIFSYLETK